MFYNLLYYILILLSICIGYYIGSHYDIINKKTGDKIDDFKELKEKLKPTKSRIISPTKNKLSSLKEFEKDTI